MQVNRLSQLPSYATQRKMIPKTLPNEAPLCVRTFPVLCQWSPLFGHTPVYTKASCHSLQRQFVGNVRLTRLDSHSMLKAARKSVLDLLCPALTKTELSANEKYREVPSQESTARRTCSSSAKPSTLFPKAPAPLEMTSASATDDHYDLDFRSEMQADLLTEAVDMFFEHEITINMFHSRLFTQSSLLSKRALRGELLLGVATRKDHILLAKQIQCHARLSNT